MIRYILLAPVLIFGGLAILGVLVAPPILFVWALITHQWAMTFPVLGLWAMSWGITAATIQDSKQVKADLVALLGSKTHD